MGHYENIRNQALPRKEMKMLLRESTQKLSMVASLQDGPQRSSPPCIHIPMWLPPTMNRAKLCNQQDTVEMECDFQGQVMKNTEASVLSCRFVRPLALKEVGQLPCCEDAQAVLGAIHIAGY